jgi:hypothetical protein
MSRTLDMPASLTVPNGSMDCVYDSTGRAYRFITVDGAADVLAATWVSPPEDGTYVVVWDVFAAPQATLIHLPLVPDSIHAAIGVNPLKLLAAGYAMVDYTPQQGYDDYTALEYASSEPEEAHYWQRYTQATYLHPYGLGVMPNGNRP